MAKAPSSPPAGSPPGGAPASDADAAHASAAAGADHATTAAEPVDPPHAAPDPATLAAKASEAAMSSAELGAAAHDAARPAANGAGEGDADDALNSQILDAIVASNAAAIDGEALLRAAFTQLTAQAAGLAMLNAVNAQQSAYVTANATVLATVTRILALRDAAPAEPGKPVAPPPNQPGARASG